MIALILELQSRKEFQMITDIVTMFFAAAVNEAWTHNDRTWGGGAMGFLPQVDELLWAHFGIDLYNTDDINEEVNN